MEPREKIEKIFQLAFELAGKVMTRAKILDASGEEEYLYKSAMLFFFSKAYKSYQAVRTLWGSGFPEDASILARTIFELGLQSRYMKEDPVPRARLFFEHDPVMRYELYLELKKLSDTSFIQTIEDRKSELSELEKDHKRFKVNYEPGKGWWGKSIKQVAKSFGRTMEAQYVGAYWEESSLVHSNVVTVKEYMSHEHDGITLMCNPAVSDDVSIPAIATVHFLSVLSDFAEALDLNLQDEISKAFTEYKTIIEENGQQ